MGIKRPSNAGAMWDVSLLTVSIGLIGTVVLATANHSSPALDLELIEAAAQRAQVHDRLIGSS